MTTTKSFNSEEHVTHFPRPTGIGEALGPQSAGPTMHQPFHVGQSVEIDSKGMGWMDYRREPITGRIVGIASMHVMYHYIVLLSKPIKDYGVPCGDDVKDSTAVSVSGCQLRPL